MKVITNALCTLLLAVSTANHAAAHSKKNKQQLRQKIHRYLYANSHPSDHAEMEDMAAVEWVPGSYTFGTYFRE
jgi:hypothetical protein